MTRLTNWLTRSLREYDRQIYIASLIYTQKIGYKIDYEILDKLVFGGFSPVFFNLLEEHKKSLDKRF